MADRRRRTLGALIAGVAVLLLPVLSACTGAGSGGGTPTASTVGTGPNGVEQLTADQILERAQAAAKAASWVHLSGTQSGTRLDLTIGKNTATGTVTEGGLTAQLLAAGGTTYVKGDKAFWDNASGAGSGDRLAGKWVVAGPTSGAGTAGLDAFTDVGRMVDTILTPGGTVTKAGVTTLGGHRVVALTDSADGTTLYVALDGPPYPVRIETAVPTTDPPSFSAWNVPATIQPPPPADVVDPAKSAG